MFNKYSRLSGVNQQNMILEKSKVRSWVYSEMYASQRRQPTF